MLLNLSAIKRGTSLRKLLNGRATSRLAGVTALLIIAPFAQALEGADHLIERAERLDRLHTLLVLHQGRTVIEHVQGGPGIDQPANIKSLSKTILSALAGIAIDRGLIESTDQALVELIGERVPGTVSERTGRITFGHALSMQTGQESTSGRNYGRWVQSDDWVAHALTRPFVTEPGERMIYSTGATHLASAALTQASGMSTLELARRWLGEPLNVRIPEWMTDPQGIYFGGNEMLLSPRALARFGELYRQGGSLNGEQVISTEWIAQSWQANGRSPWTGDEYGYGWFITDIAGHVAYYGRGFGGQALFVLPEPELTIVITSDPNPPSPGGSYFRELRSLAALVVLQSSRHY
jgi:CubicO group peptidase (beta-lactamase class C family)